jgi:phosphoglucosamine mutase
MIQNIFGTDGIRGPVGKHPFTRDALPELGCALGSWIEETYGTDASILVAHDTRESCSWIKTALASGLLLHKVKLIDAQVLPTPAILQLMQSTFKKVSCGIIISASHNPYHDNGIKIIDALSGKLSEAAEKRISELFYSDATPYTEKTKSFGTITTLTAAQNYYQKSIIDLFPQKFLRGKKVVLDCAHGATFEVAQKIFEACGAEVIAINNQPDGVNINKDCGALHVKQLQETVLSSKSDVGFAFDGDGDRVIGVNNRGEIKNGDDFLALLSTHPKYRDQTAIVGTVMSNQGLEQYLKKKQKTLLRTNVGDKHVARALTKEGLLIGGEQSGHIIIKDYLGTGDGIVAALYTLQAMLETGNLSMETFTRYPQILSNYPVQEKKNLTLSPFREIIERSQASVGSGRLLVRYSGTESVLRIMAEAETVEKAEDIVTDVSQQLMSAFAQ